MSAFTNGFNIGFVSGMFDRMFGGFNPFMGFNPFCNWNCGWNMNIWSGFNSMPMFFTPTINTSVFTAPPMSYNYTMPAINTTAGWNSGYTNWNNGFDTFSYTNIGNNTVNKTTLKNTSNNSTKTTKAKTYLEMSDSEMRSVYGNYTKNITVPYKGTADDLNKYLKDKGVLAGKGQAFIDAQKQYGISASVLAAICVNESDKGSSDLAKNNNNVAGVRNGNKGWKKYNSVEECIKDVARFLKSGYVNQNLVTLYQVNAKYCPVQDKEDTKHTNNGWAANVNRYANEIEKV